jgi:integrase
MASAFEKRSGQFWAKYKDRYGTWRSIPTKEPTLKRARDFAREKERAERRIGEGIDPDLGDAANETFGALAEWWIEGFSPALRSKSFAGYLRKHVVPAIGRIRLRQLRPHPVEALLDELQHKGGLTPKSCNDIRASMNRVFTRAAERGRWNGPNPIAQVKRRVGLKRPPPPILRWHEVPRFLEAAGEWRAVLACAVWMGLRRGEVLALRKQDVNLEDRTMVIGRSHGADTTKGGHADVLPIPKPLVPYLVQAINESDSELLFPAADGKRRSAHTNLKAVVKRTLVHAGLIEKYVLHCRGWKCGHREEAAEPVSKRCPKCDLPLWSKATPRDVGFHGLRHSTATLLLKSKVPYAIVQRIMRHRDPRLTTETYGHLEVDDMRIALDELAERTAPVLPESLAAASSRESFGAYLVPSHQESGELARASVAKVGHPLGKTSGPSRIRTWDQSVMSRQLYR